MSDLQWKSTAAQHPIGRKRNADLCHGLRMYPIASVIHSPNQLLPTIVQAPKAKQILRLQWVCYQQQKSVIIK